jgi:hypothetical protein
MPRYQIIVSGGLGEAGREAFRDFHSETHGRDTVLTGDLDQPGLLGALARIEGLGLEVAGFSCLAPAGRWVRRAEQLHRPGARPSLALQGPAAHGAEP